MYVDTGTEVVTLTLTHKATVTNQLPIYVTNEEKQLTEWNADSNVVGVYYLRVIARVQGLIVYGQITGAGGSCNKFSY